MQSNIAGAKRSTGTVAVISGLLFTFIFCHVPPPVQHRPNIVLIVADDMGYSDLGCFGSEIETPNIDRLAAAGRIFSNFYTAPACSPTRAMLLSGIDHHLAGLGNMAEFLSATTNQEGQPGYEGHLNRKVVSVATLLRKAGYHTYIAGKWHLGRTARQSPTAQGFERSYVLMEGTANNYYPDTRWRSFWADGTFVRYPQGTFSTEWYTDKLIEFVRDDQADEQPFFLYAAYTAPHWPLQAPKPFIEKYRGRYDNGYEALREERLRGLIRQGIVPEHTMLPPLPAQKAAFLDEVTPFRSWKELTEDEKKISARSMEVYAGMLDNLDFHIGRLIDYLKAIDEYENTLFLFLSDNGADAKESNLHPPGFDPLTNMGNPHSFVAYGAGWAQASGVYNRLYKAYATEGGIHTPLIVKMPRQHQGSGVTATFTSVLDVVPTILDICGLKYPDAHRWTRLHPLEGQSLLPFLQGKVAAVHGPDPIMGWELFGRTALRKGNWKITQVPSPLGSGTFELFNLETDPGESTDLASDYPDKLREMKALWEAYRQAKGVVLPDWK